LQLNLDAVCNFGFTGVAVVSWLLWLISRAVQRPSTRTLQLLQLMISTLCFIEVTSTSRRDEMSKQHKSVRAQASYLMVAFCVHKLQEDTLV
jgi:hypothetical protein